MAVVCAMTTQLGGIGTNDQYLVASFQFLDGEYLPDFHWRYLHARRKIDLLDENTGQGCYNKTLRQAVIRRR